MKQTKNKIAAALAVCAIATSFAACSQKDNGTAQTSVVTNEQTVAVTEITYPEKDADGSQISVVKVTDAEGNTVTNAEGAAVTEPVIVDAAGNILTDAKGVPVTPNLAQEQHIVATDVTAAGNTPAGNSGSAIQSSEGPTVNITGTNGDSALSLKAGDEFKVNITSLESPGYTGLFAWVDIDTDIFDIVEVKSGDPDDENYFESPARNNVVIKRFKKSEDPDLYTANPNTSSNFETLMLFYFDAKLKAVTEKTVLGTVTLKVKDSAAAGEYTLGFDKVQNSGESQCNTVNENKDIVNLAPKFTDMKITIE